MNYLQQFFKSFLGAALILGLYFTAPAMADDLVPDFQILYSANLLGEVEPCG